MSPFPVPMGSRDEPGHVHQWKRLPVVDFGVTYGCEPCNRAIRISPWFSGMHKTLDQVDAAFIAHLGEGGVFAGEMCPAASSPPARP